jgi:Na+/H+-dicarboxylate symporter
MCLDLLPSRDMPQGSKRLKRWLNRCLHIARAHFLLVLTVAGVILGIIIGLIGTQFQPSSVALSLVGLPGTLFLKLLRMTVIPLIFCCMVTGVTSVGKDSAAVGLVSRRVVVFVVVTMFVAVVIGVVVVNLVQPGSRFQNVSSRCRNGAAKARAAASSAPVGASGALLATIEDIVPDNIVKAAADGNVLGVIFFSIFVGVVLRGLGERTQIVVSFISELNVVITVMVEHILKLTPFGVMSLIASKVMTTCDIAATFASMGFFAGAVVLALVAHGLVFLPALYFALTRTNPFKFLGGMSQALLTVFGTSSSAAAMPVATSSTLMFDVQRSHCGAYGSAMGVRHGLQTLSCPSSRLSI